MHPENTTKCLTYPGMYISQVTVVEQSMVSLPPYRRRKESRTIPRHEATDQVDEVIY